MSAAIDLDQFHEKIYHPTDYNCSHFIRDVWLAVADVDIGPLVCAFNSGDSDTAMVRRKDLTALGEPQEPCIVWFCTDANDPPHVGVFIEGKVFHMTPDGPRMQPLSFVAAQYKRVKYYHA